MPSQRPIPPSEWSDKELESYTFGPFAAVTFDAANKHVLLPIDFPKDVVIHDVRIRVQTVTSVASTVFALTKGTINSTTKVVTAPSGALTSTSSSGGTVTYGNQVCTSRNINNQVTANRLEWLPVQKGYTSNMATTFNSQVQPGDPTTDGTTGVWENVIEKGNNLYMYCSASATALAGLYVTIRVGERRTDVSSWR